MKMAVQFEFGCAKQTGMRVLLGLLLLCLIPVVPGVNGGESDPQLQSSPEKTQVNKEGEIPQEIKEPVKKCKRTLNNCDPSKTNCVLEMPCEHGVCNEQGYCVCEPCWDGESCDDLVDLWAPSFESKEASVIVSNAWNDQPIFTAVASDRDLNTTCLGAEGTCSCSQVAYSIIGGNLKEVFTLDETTGRLYISDPTAFLERQMFHLEIGAWARAAADNDTDPDSVLKLRVASDKASPIHGHPNAINDHHRAKREIETTQDELKPDEESENYKTDFKLTLKNGDPGAMEIGKVLNFELVVTVPPTERLDLQLDIFTKDVVADSFNPVLSIFDIVVNVPPEMTLSSGEPQISKILSSQQGSNVYDRIMVNFGDIINPDTARKIVMTFSVTVARIKSTYKVHYVTVGAEYDFERFIWISQTEITVQNAKPNEDEKLVEADADGPKEIAMDSAGIFTVDAFLKLRSDKVEISVKGPTTLEDVISVGNLGVTGFGAHFQSIPQDVVHYRTVKTPSATKDSYIKASIDMGVLTNTGSMYQKPRTANNENKVSFTFGLFALTREDTIGSEQSFTVAIDVAGNTLWQETLYVNITQRSDNETINNIEDSRVAIAPPRALLGNLLQYEVHLNLTPSAFTEIYVVQEFDPTNPITLCSGRFARGKSGFNIVWANTTSTKAIIMSDPDQIALDMGRIYVSEQRSGISAMESTAVLELFFFVDPEAVDPATLRGGEGGGNPQPVKLRVGRRDDPLLVSVEPLIIEPKRFINPPDVRMEDAVTWREIYVGGAVAYDIVVTLPLGAMYTNLSLSVTDLSNIQLPGAHICRARVSHIGRGLPCAQSQRDLMNENSIFYSKIQPEREDIDSVLIQFDRLCHLAQSPNNQTESQVIINVVANLQGEQSFQNGQPFALHTVVSLNNKAIYQEDKKFNMARPPSKDFLKNQPAHVYFTNLSPSFVPGGVGDIEIVVKTPPRTMALYLVELSTSDPDVSICILKIKSIGDSMPCVEEDTPAEYILHSDPDNGNKKASLALNALANVGTYPMKPGRFLDPNSLVLTAIVKIGPRATRNKSLKLKVSYGSKGQMEDTIVLPVANVHNTTGLLTPNGAATPPRTLLLAPSEPALTSLAPGSVALVTLTAELVEFSSSRLRFDLTLNDGVVRSQDIEVCHEGISHLGKNYPCSAPQQWSKHGEGENLLGQYNLGLLCNSFIERNKQEDNYVRFTVPIMLKKDAKYAEGTPFSLNSQIITTGGKEQKSLQLSVASKPEQTIGQFFKPSVKASSASEESIGIRQRRWVAFNITVPKGAMTEVTVAIQGAKTDKVAIVVVHDLRIAAVGRNIPCYQPSKLAVSLSSSFNNVQNDRGQASLGYFANPGYSHVRGRFRQGDDDIVVEAYVELTDHESTDDGSKHPVTIQVEMSGWKGSAKQELITVRTGREATSIDVKLTVDNSRPFERGDAFSVMAEMRHFVSSLMEPTKLALRLFLPHFVTFGGVSDVRSGSNYQPEVKNASNGVNIIFPKLLFADEVRLNMTLLSDPENRRGYGTGVIDATSLYRVECEYTPRKDQVFEPFCSEQHFLAYKVNSDECVLNLGMEDGTIKDCQITASSAVDFEHAPFKARKGSPQAWSPGIREGMSEPHLDIAFLRVTRVSQIEVIYVPSSRRVHRYRLQASNDGRNWWDHLQTRTLVYQNGVAMDRLPEAVQARHLRIIIVDAADEHVSEELNVGLQIELYGCYIGAFTEEENCPKDTTFYTNQQEPKTRHMTVDTNSDIAYFCDFTDASGKVCMSSSDGGVSWKLQPRFVGRLLGFDQTRGLVYARDRATNNGSLLATKDGLTWMSLHENEVKLNALTQSVVIPARSRRALFGKEEFNFGKWKAAFDGVFYSDAESPAARWGSCCAPRGGGTTTMNPFEGETITPSGPESASSQEK